VNDADMSGQWRLAEQELDQAVGGILRHRRQGSTRLELFGALTGLGDQGAQRHIWGVTTDGQAVTLANCFRVNHRTHSGSAYSESEEWHVNRGLVGEHVADLDNTEFDSATIRVDLLSSLTDHPSFQYRHEVDPSISIEPPQELTATWRGIEVSLAFPESYESDTTSIRYESGPVFTCNPPAPMRLVDLQKQLLSPLKNLTSLFVGRPASILAIELRRPDARTRGGKYVDRPLRLFYNPIGTSKPTDRLVHPILHLYEQDLFDSAVRQWLEASNEGEASSAIEQYFATQDAPAAFVELRFLSLVYVAEDYHRTRSNETVEPGRDFDERINRLVCAAQAEGLSPKEVKWLRGKLKRANELPLAKRLRSIVTLVNPQLDSLIGHPGRFAESVAATRNYLTHRVPNLRDEAASGSDLFWLEQAMQLVVATMIISETGLASETIRDGFSRNANLRWVRERTRSQDWGHT